MSKKFKLKDLKVQSFVTETLKKEVRGGDPLNNNLNCSPYCGPTTCPDYCDGAEGIS